MLELYRLLEAVAGDIALHLGDHVFDRLADRILVSLFAQAIVRIAHDQRRLGRVEHDDRLAPRCPADVHNRLSSRLGELVDIGAGARTRALAGDRGGDLAIVDLGDAVHCRDDRDRRLPAAGDYVDVLRIEALLAVDRRDHIGADRRRRQVDYPLASGLDQLVVALVRARAGRIEDDLDVRKLRHGNQALDPLVRGRYAHALRACEPIGGRIDPEHHAHFEHL